MYAGYSTSLFTPWPVYVHINKQRRTTYASFARAVRLCYQIKPIPILDIRSVRTTQAEL